MLFILKILSLYLAYFVISILIIEYDDDKIIGSSNEFVLCLFGGIVYYIPLLIIKSIKNKNKEELKRKQEEIERLGDRIYSLIFYDNDIFRDIKNKYNFIYNIENKQYAEYEDLENKRQRIIDKCYNILHRIIKINRYAEGYEEEFTKAINDTYDALKEIDDEYKDRENKVKEELKKVNKEKLKQELEELNQLKKNEIEYFKYGNGEM